MKMNELSAEEVFVLVSTGAWTFARFEAWLSDTEDAAFVRGVEAHDL
jgi:hypothetical protein